ncbi:GGDEF domain-containing protein [Sphingomonas colocasiae]|uniref:diguanylate cyclase n=1 Tax=Sphingomonas colocasiae TaxID=1848973 RepID=A0ABS7PSG0_9SPHN|nr:GGDEF domain-containing protein [Sphingomonas colocasiae]MBY8822929.1 GGDEF domain-containing protein [Sphingomonas colocasiae]
MTPAIVILSVLFFTSAILCIMMTLAWLHFGRARHISIWAVAYGLGALQWVVNALGVLLEPGNPLPVIAASLVVLGSSALVPVGALQRAGRPVHLPAFIAIGLIFAIWIVLVYTILPNRALQGAVSNLFAVIMMPIAAIAIWPRHRRPNAPELAFIVMLVIFTLYQLALSGSALFIGPDGDRDAIERYRMILGIGLPPVYIGTGIAAVFLIAGDLSESLQQLVTRDGLTGALNRRGLEQAATIAMANARRRGRPFTVVICDIDHFKRINDRFGHAAGDRALISFADNVQAVVREVDMFGRLGGDEFCLLLSDLAPADAGDVVERIRAEVAGISVEDKPDLAFTASFGVAGFDDGDLWFGQILQRADQALYQAKEAGRNRIAFAARPEPTD